MKASALAIVFLPSSSIPIPSPLESIIPTSSRITLEGERIAAAAFAAETALLITDTAAFITPLLPAKIPAASPDIRFLPALLNCPLNPFTLETALLHIVLIAFNAFVEPCCTV